MNTSPTTEERIWAVLSHLSALAFGMGILLPVIGWSEQRRKSKYIAFQCLQALGYQSLGYTVWILSYLLAIIILIIIFAIAIATVEQNRSGREVAAGIWAAIFIGAVIGLFGVYFLLPVIATVACALGKDFRYPILGNRLAKYLGFDKGDYSMALIEDHEDRWVAAMGHFSVIIPLWGILAPITAWILRGKHSFFLKFQSIQTTVYQAFVNIIYMGAGLIYFFGAIVFTMMAGLEGGLNPSSSTGMVGLLIFGLSLLFASVIFLIIPLFHILGQCAGYRVLIGDDYHYHVVGRLVGKWIADESPLTADNGVSNEGKTQ
jgi:uncharacterized Tic20 family protein